MGIGNVDLFDSNHLHGRMASQTSSMILKQITMQVTKQSLYHHFEMLHNIRLPTKKELMTFLTLCKFNEHNQFTVSMSFSLQNQNQCVPSNDITTTNYVVQFNKWFSILNPLISMHSFGKTYNQYCFQFWRHDNHQNL